MYPFGQFTVDTASAVLNPAVEFQDIERKNDSGRAAVQVTEQMPADHFESKYSGMKIKRRVRLVFKTSVMK